MFGTWFRRSLLAAFAGLSMTLIATAPAGAYGPSNWQATFNGTGVVPNVGGFGFWGWCAFGGGETSGNSADCEFSQYNHGLIPIPSGTCEESLDGTSWWVGQNGDFFASGTITVHPASETQLCLALFPGTTSTSFTGADTGIPAAAGHYHFGSILGAVGEFNETVVHVK